MVWTMRLSMLVSMTSILHQMRHGGQDHATNHARCFYDTSLLASMTHLWATIHGISIPVTDSFKENHGPATRGHVRQLNAYS
jgi:hypothetical protein